MICIVKVADGIIPMPPGVELLDGAEVQVTVPDSVAPPSFAERYAKYIGAAEDLPADLAENLDHYVHGHEKKWKQSLLTHSIFVALLNRRDQHHAKVIVSARESRENLVTTEWVLRELADGLAKSASRRLVAPFFRDLSEDWSVKIVWVTSELFQRGLRLYDERQDKGWTLTDCTSFVVMEDENITEALTGDHHFEQAGFMALLM